MLTVSIDEEYGYRLWWAEVESVEAARAAFNRTMQHIYPHGMASVRRTYPNAIERKRGEAAPGTVVALVMLHEYDDSTFKEVGQ